MSEIILGDRVWRSSGLVDAVTLQGGEPGSHWITGHVDGEYVERRVTRNIAVMQSGPATTALYEWLLTHDDDTPPSPT